MTDFYSQNRCVCSTRSHGPLLCAFCLSFHFNCANIFAVIYNIIIIIIYYCIVMDIINIKCIICCILSYFVLLWFFCGCTATIGFAFHWQHNNVWATGHGSINCYYFTSGLLYGL